MPRNISKRRTGFPKALTGGNNRSAIPNECEWLQTARSEAESDYAVVLKKKHQVYQLSSLRHKGAGPGVQLVYSCLAFKQYG